MKTKIAISLLLFFTCYFYRSDAQTRNSEWAVNNDNLEFSIKDSTRYKKTVATVITPEYRKYTTGYGKHHTTHYIAYVGFIASDIEVSDEIEDASLYFNSSKGDRFTVFYDSLQPHHFHILTNEPQLDASSRIDTTIVTISSIYPWSNEINFLFHINTIDSIKIQEVVSENQCIYDVRPDLVRGRKFKAIYNTKHPDKPIVLINQPVDLNTYHYKQHNNMIGLTTLPFSKMELVYQHIVWKNFAMGVTGTVYFDPFHEANFFSNAGKHTTSSYTDQYFEFKNAWSVSPQVKWYVCNHAPLAFYFKMQGSYLSTEAKANYFNTSDIPKDTTAISFLSMDPSYKVETVYKKVNAFGIQSGAGMSFFMGSSYRWVWDAGLGFQYYFYPGRFKTTKEFNSVTYYYHDMPAWDNFFNFPCYMELNVFYKF